MKLAGYIFQGLFYKELDQLRGMTMSEGHAPIPVYSKEPNFGEWVDGWLTDTVTFTKGKGYIQMFGSHKVNGLVEEWNTKQVMEFLEWLRKKKRINFKKPELKRWYEEYIEGE